jgi:Uma2 family endonuclease
MSTAFATQPPAVRESGQRYTVAQYEELGQLGIITEDNSVELLEGWIVPKMTKHPAHDNTIDLIQYLLAPLLPAGWFIRIQNCVVTGDSVPEPDLAIVRGRPGDYGQRHPSGGDVALIVEIADTTLARDRAKAPIYARAGIPHYWIVNLVNRHVIAYSQPTGAGFDSAYQSHVVRAGQDELEVVVEGTTAGMIEVRRVFA